MHAKDPAIRLLPMGIVCAALLLAIAGCGAQAGLTSRPSKATYDKVTCRTLSFSPDGDHLIVGGSPKFVRSFRAKLFDASSGREVASIRNLGCERVQFSPDGSFFVTGGWLGEVTLWNAKTGESIKSVSGHRLPIRAISLSTDGRIIATAGDDGLVKLWNAESLIELGTLKGHAKPVSCLAISSNSELLATGSEDKTVRLWSLSTMEQIGEPIQQEWSVWFVALSPDGKWLATAGSDCGKEGGLTFWDVASREVRKRLPNHQFAVFARNGGLCAVTTMTNATVVLLDVNTGEEKRSIVGNHESHYTLGFVPKVDFSPDGQTLAIGTQGIGLIDTTSGATRRLSEWSSDWIDSVAFSLDGTKLAVSPAFGKPGVVDAATGNRLYELGTAKASSFVFSPDGSRLVTSYYGGSAFGTIAVLNAKTGQQESEIRGHLRPVTSVAVSHNGKLLASGSLDRTVRLWDLKTNESLGVLSGHGANVYQVALAPDGAHLATASEQLRIWNVQRQEVEKTFDGFDGLVYSVAYSPGGELLAAGNGHGAVVVWETADWSKRVEIKEEWPIRSLGFSPDGKTLAVAGGKVERGIVEFRNVSDLALVKSLEGHKGAVTSASFSADGQTLVTCSIDKTVKRWSVGTGRITGSATPLEMGVAAVAISPTSSTVVAGGTEGISLPGSK